MYDEEFRPEYPITCIGKTRSNAIDNSFGVREVPTIPSRKSALTHWAQ